MNALIDSKLCPIGVYPACGPLGAPAVVMLHGVCLTGAMWATQAQSLSLRNRVLCPDLPGHGIRADERFTFSLAVEGVARIIREHAGGKALVVGLSLGGYTAIELIAAHPELVSGAVLAGCTMEPRGFWAWTHRMCGHLCQIVPDRPLLTLGSARILAVYRKEISDPIKEGGFFVRPVTDVAAQLRGRRFAPQLATTSLPLLFINGKNDFIFRRDEDIFIGKAPASRLEIIPGAWHLSNLDRPEAFTSLVREHAARVGW